MSRTFHVEQYCTVNKTVTWEVEADSFEQAEQRIYEGWGSQIDEDEWDTEYNDVGTVRCTECDEEDEDDCECAKVDEVFMAELGL
jgi:hypothetical protein